MCHEYNNIQNADCAYLFCNIVSFTTFTPSPPIIIQSVTIFGIFVLRHKTKTLLTDVALSRTVAYSHASSVDH